LSAITARLMRIVIQVPLLGALVLLGAPLLLAQSGRSPFLPPDAQAAPVAADDAPLQFIGFFGEGENMRYCVYDPARRRSVWLRAGDADGPIQLQSFDAENRTVNVVHQGQSLTLKLQSAKVAQGGGGGGGTVGPLPVAGAQAGGNPLVNTVVTNPTPADEARRLEAVAAEVRRRRAMRQAAAQNQGQPTPVEVAPRNTQ
jgi:hypothetical protein